MSWFYSIPPFLTATLLLALSALAFWRSGGGWTNRLFGLLCLLGGVLYIDILIGLNAASGEIARLTNRSGHFLYPFLVPLFIHFFHTYLGVRRRWVVIAAYGWALALAPLAFGDQMISGARQYSFGYTGRAGPLYPVMAAGTVLATLYNLLLIRMAMRNERHAARRNRLGYILVGVGGLGVLSSLNFLSLFGVPVYPPGAFGFLPMAVLAAGLFRHDLLDFGLLWRKSLLFSFFTAALTAVYALVIVMVQALISGRLAESYLFPVLLFVLITFLFGPLKQRAQSALEKRFTTGRYDYQQTIKRVSRTIAAVLDYGTIDRLMRETLIEAMQVEKGMLMIRTGKQGRFVPLAVVGAPEIGAGQWEPQPALVQRLETDRQPLRRPVVACRGESRDAAIAADLNRWRAEIVFPMHFEERLNGLLILGEKRSGAAYSREDIDLMETLCAQSALAIENAAAYQALKTLNRNLEQKVADRTRELESALIEKERTQEQLIRSESLAALGQLVAGVAHELNNPLASVTSLLQSTREDLRLWDPQQPPDEAWIEDLDFADKELRRAKSIVGSLLGLARQTQTYTEEFDFNAVVQDALRVLHNQFKHTGIRIEQDLAAPLPTILGNFANLGQVVVNIIKNALQAVADHPDGRISIRSRYDPDCRQILFMCRDNGCGIAEAIRKDVFKPFYTTKPVGQGTGLGLYISHEIARKHGGSIDLHAAQPHGTILTVRLPVACPQAFERGHAFSKRPAGRFNSKMA